MQQEEEIRKLNNLIRNVDFQLSDLDDEIKKIQKQNNALDLELRMKMKEFQQIKIELDSLRQKDKGFKQSLFTKEDEKISLKKKRNELFGKLQSMKNLDDEGMFE